MIPLFVTIPHSGEIVPPEATWLKGLSEVTLFRDVDRFVDQLYQPALDELKISSVKAEFHRYVVDLNRIPEDVDQDSVEGARNPPGTFPLGFHWVQTTIGERLIHKPLSVAVHELLTERYFKPFHAKVVDRFSQFKSTGHTQIFHLDAHSMPSQGTSAHRDSGQARPQIVVSDQDGVSCSKEYSDLVTKAFELAGFQVAYNWPYKGGRITQVYGKPELGQNTLQVEMNRSLYMNEDTKKIVPEKAALVQAQILKALSYLVRELPKNY